MKSQDYATLNPGSQDSENAGAVLMSSGSLKTLEMISDKSERLKYSIKNINKATIKNGAYH